MIQDVLRATEQFKIEVVELKGQQHFFIRGHISTTDSDKYNDVVTDSAQDDLVNQLKSLPITMDLEHESFKDDDGEIIDRPLDKIPVAKIVEVERTAKGTEVKAELNQAHPQFKSILKSIKDRFLHSFSIAYIPVDHAMKSINGVMHRILDKVDLLNVGITGIPVNANATFRVVTKSYCEKKMGEENQTKIQAELVQVKSEMDTQKKDFEAKSNEIKSEHDKVIEAKEKELNEIKSELEKSKKALETSTATAEGAENEVKSVTEKVEAISKDMNEIKSLMEKLKAPVHKGQVDVKDMSGNLAGEQAKVQGVLSYIA